MPLTTSSVLLAHRNQRCVHANEPSRAASPTRNNLHPRSPSSIAVQRIKESSLDSCPKKIALVVEKKIEQVTIKKSENRDWQQESKKQEPFCPPEINYLLTAEATTYSPSISPKNREESLEDGVQSAITCFEDYCTRKEMPFVLSADNEGKEPAVVEKSIEDVFARFDAYRERQEKEKQVIPEVISTVSLAKPPLNPAAHIDIHKQIKNSLFGLDRPLTFLFDCMTTLLSTSKKKLKNRTVQQLPVLKVAQLSHRCLKGLN